MNSPLPQEGRVEASELPGGRAVVALHVGPYESLSTTWQELCQWMKEQGVEGRAPPWEVYLSDCSITPAAQLQTRIVWPIETEG